MWYRQWQCAASVVDRQCGRIQVVQFVLVGPVNQFLNLVNVVSHSNTMFGWGLARGANCQLRGQGVICDGVRALELPICHWELNRGLYGDQTVRKRW